MAPCLTRTNTSQEAGVRRRQVSPFSFASSVLSVKSVVRIFALFEFFAAMSCFLTAPCAHAERDNFAVGDVTKLDFFPILPLDPYHGWTKPFVEHAAAGLETIAECNFNMAGFVLPRDLRRCEKLGLGAIMLPTDNAFTNHEYLRDWKNRPDGGIEREVRNMIRAAGSSPAIMGYFLMDEPGVG